MLCYKKGKNYCNAWTSISNCLVVSRKHSWPQLDITNKLEYTLKTCISYIYIYIYKIHNRCTHAPVWQSLNGISSLLVWSIASPVENIADSLMAAVAPVNLACRWKLWQIISWSADRPAIFLRQRWNTLIVSINVHGLKSIRTIAAL